MHTDQSASLQRPVVGLNTLQPETLLMGACQDASTDKVIIAPCTQIKVHRCNALLEALTRFSHTTLRAHKRKQPTGYHCCGLAEQSM